MAEVEQSYDLELLKSLKNCSVKTMENVGDFKLMVMLKCKNPEFTLRFHFAKKDSDIKPSIIILSRAISNERLLDLQTQLSSSSTVAETGYMTHTYNFVKNKIEALSISENQVIDENKRNQLNKPNKKKNKTKTSKRPAEIDVNGDLIVEKKGSMKTAIDVVNRILWDDAIPKQDITIGYMDRFRGVIEKSFFAFSWEDIASIDYYTFAVPKHRLEYFKYRKAKVWDKRSRLDNVFGSLNSGLTITDIIANYKDEDYPDDEDVSARSTDLHTDSNENGDAQDFNDDDEEDVEIVIGPTSAPPPVSRLCSITLSEDEDEWGASGTAHESAGAKAEDKTYWQDKLRPNFFICVRISNPDIKATTSKIQDSICDREPRYDSCCTPEALLHITLCTLRLNDAEQVSQCLHVLREAKDELQVNIPSTPLHLRGIDRFFGRVLYAKIDHHPQFLSFVNHLELVLKTAGMPLTDSHEFVPHMSLLKVNRPVSRLIGTKNINPLIYYGAENIEFGEQIVDSIYLCSMEKTRGEDGFYTSAGYTTFMQNIL